MLNWKKFRNLIVTERALFKKGAVIAGENADGSVTDVSVSELVALNDLGATDLQKIDGITNGTAAANKALVLGASKEIGIISTATITTINGTDVDAGASGTAGSVDVFPATASKGKLAVTCTDQTGDTTVSVVAGAMAAARTITLRDPGAAASLLTTTDATAAATTATALEITRSCDTSGRVVTTTSTALSLTVTEHAERLVLINTNSTVANTFTLPAAAGTGEKFTLINNIAQTQGTVVIAANGTDVLSGICFAMDSTAAADAMTFLTSATSDKISMDLTTTGGLGGDMVEAWDSAANTWTVRVVINGSGSLATPFSAT